MPIKDCNCNKENTKNEVQVKLKKIIDKINLPISIRFATLPREDKETMFIATQVGEIIAINGNKARLFVDLKTNVLTLGSNKSKLDERGLLGIAFHPEFNKNGKLYLYYSQYESERCSPLYEIVDPCNSSTLKQEWNRSDYDHVDVLEEWIYNSELSICEKNRILLQVRQPFSNNNGRDNLIFGPDRKLILGLGDGGAELDPFNLAQDEDCLLGKLLSIDVNNFNTYDTSPVSYISELPTEARKVVKIIVKGIHNTSHPAFDNNIAYLPNMGGSSAETISTFNCNLDKKINLGWRAWEGNLPTTLEEDCINTEEDPRLVIIWDYEGFPKTGEGVTIKIREGDTIAFISNDEYFHGISLADSNWRIAGKTKNKYNINPSSKFEGKIKFNEVGEYYLIDPCFENRLKLKVKVLANHHRQDEHTTLDSIVYVKESLYMKDRHLPLVSLHHRNMKMSVSQITGGEIYRGNINGLNGKYVFTDLSDMSKSLGSLFFTKSCKYHEIYGKAHKINVDHSFKSRKNFYVSLGINEKRDKLYLGVYGSMCVKDLGLGSVYEIVQSDKSSNSKCNSSNSATSCSKCTSGNSATSCSKCTSGNSSTSCSKCNSSNSSTSCSKCNSSNSSTSCSKCNSSNSSTLFSKCSTSNSFSSYSKCSTSNSFSSCSKCSTTNTYSKCSTTNSYSSGSNCLDCDNLSSLTVSENCPFTLSSLTVSELEDYESDLSDLSNLTFYSSDLPEQTLYSIPVSGSSKNLSDYSENILSSHSF
jgi:hypothetical protein